MLARNPMAKAWDLLDVALAAERSIMKIVDRKGPINYDLVEGDVSDWYLVQTYPGQDLLALRWLARRGFGVFQPTMQRVQRASKMLVQGREPMFPGWIFVFCRDIRKHSSRIKVCPYVGGILSDPASNRPIPIDQPEMSADGTACKYPRIGFVDKLRAWSENYNPDVPHLRAGQAHYEARSNRNMKRSRRRLTPKERKNLERMMLEAKTMEIWDQEQWEQIMRLDPGARIGMLMAVLNSASDVGASASVEA